MSRSDVIGTWSNDVLYCNPQDRIARCLRLLAPLSISYRLICTVSGPQASWHVVLHLTHFTPVVCESISEVFSVRVSTRESCVVLPNLYVTVQQGRKATHKVQKMRMVRTCPPRLGSFSSCYFEGPPQPRSFLPSVQIPSFVMALRQRLLRDIAEIERNPYPNIVFRSHENDIRKACLLLSSDDTTHLHLAIDFPNDYPLSPPIVTIQSDVVHSNVFGNYICASILNTTEGYSPAYDLKGICIQLLSFFASDTLEQEHGGTVNIKGYRNIGRVLSRYGRPYICQECGFGTAAMPHTMPTSTSLVSLAAYLPPEYTPAEPAASEAQQRPVDVRQDSRKENKLCDKKSTPLADLPDELLVLICDHLEAEELAPFSRAWNRIGGETGLINRFNVVRNRELICFCLKTDFNSVKLGVGVHVDQHGRIGSLESEFDLVSLRAFEEFHISRSVQGLPFEHWLPLPISRRHYDTIKDVIDTRLKILSDAARFPTFSPVNVVYAFMNDIIVRLSSQAESGFSHSSLVHASEKAIESYYHLFHLLLCLATTDRRVVRDANQTIKSFLVGGKTSKADIPNLGHLLIACLISDADMTNDLLKAILRETITRNCVWMLDKRGANLPELAYMEADSISRYRLQQTFDASKTSYRLLMFLNLFRRTVNRGTGANKISLVQLRERLFDAHGAPPRGTAARLASDIKALQKVNGFPDFLAIMGLTPPPASTFTTFLRDCVEASMSKGYSVWGISQAKALTLRQQKDPEVQVRQEQKKEWAGRGTFNVSFFPNNRGGGTTGGYARGSGRGGRGR